MKKTENREDRRFIVQLDERRFVNRDNVDCIKATYAIPESTERWDEMRYVIYLKNSHYKWVSVSEESFEKYVKPFVY